MLLFLSGNQAETRSIGSIIRRRMCDEKVGVRKAALQVCCYINFKTEGTATDPISLF